jgi:hypothetical protein
MSPRSWIRSSGSFSNPLLPSRLFSDEERANVYTRTDALSQRNRLVGSAWTNLKEAFYGPDASSLLVSRYCAPRVDHGYELEAIRHRLARRAGSWRQEAVSSAGELRGYIDRLTLRAIEGWAQNGEHPEAPVCLDIYVEGRLVGQTLAKPLSRGPAPGRPRQRLPRL